MSTLAGSRGVAYAAVPLPNTLLLGLSRGVVEVKQFFRQKDFVIFTFTLPALLLTLLGLVFDEPAPGTDLPHGQVFTAGMVGYGILSTAFIGVGVGISMDREDGTLKRLRGTPVSVAAYLLGKIVLVTVATLAEVGLLLVVGVAAFHLRLPTQPGHWLTFGWLLALSIVACTLLGIAAGGLARSARSALAVLNLPAITLGFISGVFVNVGALPPALTTVAAFFPLKWMGQGFRSVFLPAGAAAQEPAGAWEPGRTALVLGAWCVAGLVLCLVTFRRSQRRTG
jgi:ABC-2 type transport system permease protein